MVLANTILSYNGIIFKLGTSLEKLLDSFPEEVKMEIRWQLVKNWFNSKLIKTHRQLIYEFSKLSQTDRDELLKTALTTVLYKSVLSLTTHHSTPTRKYIETLAP
jgi:hypothetical protein